MVSKVKRKYAKGANAKAIDDRTGFKVNLSDMRKEWNGLMVHKDEWEPKHPQLRPRSAIDAQQLRNPRPDTSTEIVRVESTHKLNVQAIFNVGQVSLTLSATPVGIAGTTAIGAYVPNAFAFAAGVAATSALGSVQTGAGVVGVAITSALGAESLTISTNVAETGVSTTVALGNEVPMALDLPAGVAATGAIGTVTVNAWGAGTWGSGTWGN